jgi:hypothetical protein
VADFRNDQLCVGQLQIQLRPMLDSDPSLILKLQEQILLLQNQVDSQHLQLNTLVSENHTLTLRNKQLLEENTRLKSASPPSSEVRSPSPESLSSRLSLSAQIVALQGSIDSFNSRIPTTDEESAFLTQQRQIQDSLNEIKAKCAELAAGQPPTREAFDQARDCNLKLAAFSRSYFSAVREDSRAIEQIIRSYYQQLVDERKKRKLVRSRIDLSHPIIGFLDAIEGRLARPVRSNT